jgi:hypothetical protein
MRDEDARPTEIANCVTTAKCDLNCQPDSFCASKAPENWRSPRRFANTVVAAKRASVLECGGPPPLFSAKLVKSQVFIVYH